MTRKTAGILAIGLCAFLRAASANAITTDSFLLAYPINPRSVAMGSIGAADNSDPSTIFFNPANVCAQSRVYAIGAQRRLDFDDVWLRSASAGISSQRAGSSWMWGADVGYTRFHLWDAEVWNNTYSQSKTVEQFEDALSFTVGSGFASAGYDVRFGAAVEMWRQQEGSSDYDHPTTRVTATTFDVGLAATLHERFGAWNITPAVGAAAMDLGQDIEYPDGDTSPLPTRFNFGASVLVESAPCNVFSARVPLVAFVCEAEAIAPKDGDFEWGIGNEIAVAQIVFLRAGVRRYAIEGSDFYNPNDPTVSSWGVGVGFPAGSFRARFDFGRQPPSAYFGSTDHDDHIGLLVEWTF